MRSKKPTKNKVVYRFSNPLSNILHNRTRDDLLEMIGPCNHSRLIVDLGCRTGVFTRCLPKEAQVIGLDISKEATVWAKKNFGQLEFICADVCHLPFKNDSVDVVICSSVLEFIQNLEVAVKQTRNILKCRGVLIAGYPIETKLLKALIELMDRRAVKTWNPRRVMTDKEFVNDPLAHKHNFFTLRQVLEKYFLLTRKKKFPSSYLMDAFSIYESVRLLKT
jgi:ubiquinone/menaquinone biosynthesis C-methylase UbiE